MSGTRQPKAVSIVDKAHPQALRQKLKEKFRGESGWADTVPGSLPASDATEPAAEANRQFSPTIPMKL